MPTLSLRWFFVLLGLFLISIGVDLHLTRTATPPIDPASERIEVADFILATRAGDLSAGQIVYRANATGLADLNARRGDRVVRTTARLTDADLALLREHRFSENDAATLHVARQSTTRERIAIFTRAAVQI